MKLLHFISGSSALLLTWLAVTFVYHAPSPRYQKTEAACATAIMMPEDKATTLEISATSVTAAGTN